MKKIFKQSFSLALALLMVLSLIPAMPLAAKAEEEKHRDFSSYDDEHEDDDDDDWEEDDD